MIPLLLIAAVLSLPVFVVIARRLCTHKPNIKTLLRIAAVLSFLFFFVAGCCILSYTLSSPASDAFMITGVGCFCVGTAFFAGPMLLVAAEKLGRKDESK